MMGLVLWYNPDPGVGMIWCEDQGPLAFIGPTMRLARDVHGLACSDELRDGVRYVRDVLSRTPGDGTRDPAEIISGFHQAEDEDRSLRVVA